jgi:hypothetical protein
VTVPQASALAFPKEVHPVEVIKADVAHTTMPAPLHANGPGGNGAAKASTPTSTANVWAP